MNSQNNQNEDQDKIDEELYSRQIIFLGFDTMKKISKLKIMIIGLRGLGAEIAKNIIVSGPQIVTLYDPNLVAFNDLGSNFYLSEDDIGKRRDESCINKLSKLNKYVKIDYIKEKNISNIEENIFNKYNVIVISEIIPSKYIIRLNEISRKNNICFIFSAVCGLSSFIFTDFGKFTIYDEECYKKRKFFIKNIEKSEKGLVTIEWNKEQNPFIKKYIIFKNVEGMNEINSTEDNPKVFEIEPKDSTSFYIGNTMNYSEYKSGGYIEETTLPKVVNYDSFINKLKEPFLNENYYINPKKKFIFLIFRALIEFNDKNGRLPLLNNYEDFKELKKITKNIFDQIDYENTKSFEQDELVFNENIIKNISFSSSAQISCMTSFTSGVVCQEIIKTTGKFRPIDQWEIFDFTQYSSIIPESEKYDSEFQIEQNNNRYSEIISVFNKKIFEKIKNLNIFLAGAGALGCELLKNLSLLGISNSVLVVDDDNIEISNLNRQILFHEEHKGLSKAKIACKSAIEINKDFKCKYLSKRISPENKSIFNKSYFDNVDFVLGAIDSKEGNYYLVKQCELYEKIFIKGGTDGPSGKIESFIPNITCSYNDIKFYEEEEEKQPSCTRREFPGKIEDCLDNSRDLFDNYFVTIINDLLDLINNNKNLLKLEVESKIDSFNLMKKYILLIKLNLNDKKNDIEKILIQFGFEEYEKLFKRDIEEIYSRYPLDDKEESKKFWENKRKPTILEFNKDDELCINFLFYFLKILSKCLNLPFKYDFETFNTHIKTLLNNQNISEYKNSLNNLNIGYLNISNPEILHSKILEEINEIKNNPEILMKFKELKGTKFEKDIPELGHIQFIHSFANLKAKSYKIPNCDRFYSLEYVGKIAPTSITSTAVVAGFIILQMIGIIINQMYHFDNKENELFNNDEDIDDEELIENGLHNLCFNLKNNDFTFEPLYERVTKIQMGINNLIPEKISRWCKISEEGNKTIKEFNQTIKNKYGINVTLILSGEDDRDIYTKLNSKSKNKKIIEKRLEMEEISNKKLEDAYFQTAQKICKEYDRKNEIFLKVKGFTDKGNYVELPVIKIQNEVIPIKN